MKKSIIIFSAIITTLSLTAYGFRNWNFSTANQEKGTCNKSGVSEYSSRKKSAPEFFCAVGTRFASIKKEDLNKIRSIKDFLPEQEIQSIISYKSIQVTILDDATPTELSEIGNSAILTDAQVKLLQSTDYSTNILIRADYRKKNVKTGGLEDSYSTPHLTIVPENQAVYVDGKDALVEYLKENSKEKTTNLEEGKLKPGKLYFTVTKTGTISNVKVVATSGYGSIDKKMIELVTEMPGKWKPAAKLNGENVDQELVLSFGLMGC